MSLLMDALRKAEKEKKEAAKRLQETTATTHVDESNEAQSGETDASGMADITSERPITRLDPTVVRSKEEIFAATASLSLEPIERENKKLDDQSGKKQTSEIDDDESYKPVPDEVTSNLYADQSSVETPAKKTDDTDGHHALDEEVIFTGDSDTDESTSPFDATFHNVPLGKADAPPELYEETIQGEAYDDVSKGYEETLPGVPAAELARDIGGVNQPTPVAAQTIFTATGTSKTPYKWKWPLIVTLTTVAIISFSVFYYFVVTPVNRNLPSPIVAKGVENLAPPTVVDIAKPVIEDRTVSGTLIKPQVEITVTQSITPQQTMPHEGDETASTSENVGTDITGETLNETETVLVPVENDTSAAFTEFPEKQQNIVKATDQTADQQVIPDVSSSIETIRPSIKISRSKSPDNTGQLINEAFVSYQTGNFSMAKEKYLEVLKDFPNNRDALLGLGALAINNNNTEEAFEIYSHLLRINPKDAIARAILIGFASNADPLNSETAIKLLIHENNDDAFLHFTLGNIYAAQARWAEAQQAFFEAYRNDSTNPRYALNLAISLDRLEQPGTALDYYNMAIELAQERQDSLDIASVGARVNTLSGKLNP